METTIAKKLPWPALFLAALLLILPSCAGEPTPTRPIGPRQALVPVAGEHWPVLMDDLDAQSLHQACAQSLKYLRRLPAGRRFTFGPYQVTARQMIQALEETQDILLRQPDPRKRTELLKKRFILLESVGSDGRGRVLFTGYYEPVLQARRQRQGPYRYPLYALPPDWVTIDLRAFDPGLPPRRLVGQVQKHRVVPYPERREIDFQGALDGKARVLAWLDDPVDAFFLHIQGSGQVVFPDGSRLRLGYAGANGRPYRSIGKLLLKEGLMTREEMSMQGIRRFLARNPQHLKRVLSHNPSYVFFRPLPAQGGPLGCYDLPLTPGRSIATDRRIFPGLALAYIQGRTPAPGGGTAPLSRFVLNQDTGGAIRGPGRLDLFYGSGDLAGDLAGRMKYPGRLFFLAPRAAVAAGGRRDPEGTGPSPPD